MALFCVTRGADLYEKLPTPVQREPGQFTVGDLHGNAAKLLYILFEHGIASGLNEYEYKQLLSIYRTPVGVLISAQLAEFSTLLDKITFAKGYSLRLVGDELCDRGENDYFTLLILERLKKDVSVDILLSNHGVLFLQAYVFGDFSAENLYPGQEQSMHNMHLLLKTRMVEWSRVKDIVEKAYIPSLKLIDYVLSWDRKQFVIFTHAPAGLEAIQSVAKKFQIPYDATSAERISEAIESINSVITRRLKTKTFHELYDLTDNHTINPLSEGDPIVYLLWNRTLKHLIQPQDINGCAVTYVNGHDGESGTYNNRICLNELLGKSLTYVEGLQGTHSYVYLPHAEFNLEHINHEEVLQYEIAYLQTELKSADDELRVAQNAITALQQKLQQEHRVGDFQHNFFSNQIKLMQSQIKTLEGQLIIAQDEACDKPKKLEYILNSELELSCQLAIHKKLIPLTEQYLSHLATKIQDSLKLEPNVISMRLADKIACINAHSSWPTDSSTLMLRDKFNAVNHLYALLCDRNKAIPSEQIAAFYRQLDAVHSLITAHRDPQWLRYMLNAAIVLTILLTGVLPGLGVLSIMALNDKPVRFWQASGHAFFNAASANKDTILTHAEEDSVAIIDNRLDC